MAVDDFVQSALWSVPELFGFDAPRRVQRWRNRNPEAAFLSSLIGIPAPYLGAFTATLKVGKALGTTTKYSRQLLKFEDNLKKGINPGRSSIGIETLGIIPLETARLAGKIYNGEEPIDALTDIGTDIALGTVIAGAFGKVLASGRHVNKFMNLKGDDVSAPLHQQIAVGINRHDQLQSFINTNQANETTQALGIRTPDEAIEQRNKLQESLNIQRQIALTNETKDYSFGSKVVNETFINNIFSFGRKNIKRDFDGEKLNTTIHVTSIVESPKIESKIGKITGDSIAASRVGAMIDAKVEGVSSRVSGGMIADRASGLPHVKYARLFRAGVDRANPSTKQVVADKNNVDNINKILDKDMINTGDGIWVTSAYEGGHIVVKRITSKIDTATEEGISHEDFLVFQTDNLEQFDFIENDLITALSERIDAFPEGKGLKPPQENRRRLPKGNVLDKADVAMSLNKGIATGQGVGVNQLKSVYEFLGVENAVGKTSKALKSFIGSHVAPGIRQFTNNPHAAFVFNTFSQAFNAAEGNVRRALYGSASITSKDLITGNQKAAPNSIIGSLETIDKTGNWQKFLETFGEVERIFEEETRGIRGIPAKRKYIQDALNFNKEKVPKSKYYSLIENLDIVGNDLINKNQIGGSVTFALNEMFSLDTLRLNEYKASGATKTIASGIPHFGITRWYKGDYRVAIRDVNTNNVIGYGTGENARQAQVRAKQLMEKLGEESVIEYKVDNDAFIVGSKLEDLELSAATVSHRDRESINKYNISLPRKQTRTNKLGFAIDTTIESSITLPEFISKLEDSHRQLSFASVYSYLQDEMADELQTLALHNPTAFSDVAARFDNIRNVDNNFTKATNKIVDKVAAPLIGKNSATKLAGWLGTYQWHSLLGMGTLHYPIVNAFNFLVTTVPQMAFVTRGSFEELNSLYSSGIAHRAQGVQPISVLDIGKMTAESFKLMRVENQDQLFKDVLEMGIERRVIDQASGRPDLITENASIGKNLVDTYKQDGIFSAVLRASSVMPEISERLGRIQSFNAGYLMATKIFNLKEADEIFQFTKNFTEQSMFKYSKEGRPQLFNNPIGAVFGQFKNWQFHYLAQMTQWLGGAGAIKRNAVPLALSAMGAAMVGGARASPGFALANYAFNLTTGESTKEAIDGAFGDGDGSIWGDAIYYGLPSLAGINITASASPPLSSPLEDINLLWQSVAFDRGKRIGAALGDGVDNLQQGLNPFGNRDFVGKLMRATAPRTFYRQMQVGVEDIYSITTGNPIAKDISTYEKVLFRVGITPTRLEETFELRAKLWNKTSERRKSIAIFAEHMLDVSEDPRAQQQLIEQATALGLPIDSIVQSYQNRLANRDGGLFDDFPKEVLNQFDAEVRRLTDK